MTSEVDDETMIHLMYAEVIDKDSYKASKQGKYVPVPFTIPVSKANIGGLSEGVKMRLSLSYLSENFGSWQSKLAALDTVTLPTAASIMATTAPFKWADILYDHDGFKWLSDYRVFVRYEGPRPFRTFVIHLPNDGFFYKEVSVEDDDKDLTNPRHQDSCYYGWFRLENLDDVWAKVAPIVAFMTGWIGTETVQKKILYHPSNNRVDLVVFDPLRSLAIEVSFERRYPGEDARWFLVIHELLRFSQLLPTP